MTGVRKEKIKITFLGGAWPTNIGNSFIDLGSIQLLKTAAPNSIINFVSGFPRWLFGIQTRSAKDRLLTRFAGKLPKRIREIPSRKTKDKILKKVSEYVEYCFDLPGVIESDYVVFSGMALCELFIKLHRPIFSKLKKNKVKIIINGAGGQAYSNREIEEYRKFLKRIKPYAFVSRDEPSFESYQDLAQYSHNGIDCAFFINDYFTPAKLRLPKYVILTFDSHPEPEFKTDKMIIRTHHSCWPTWLSKGYFSKPNTLISDLPDGYLNLYANTEETHSDRVHACVATLSFGCSCKLYTSSPRASLFDRVGAITIRNELTHPNTKRIEKEKKKQIDFFYKILAS